MSLKDVVKSLDWEMLREQKSYLWNEACNDRENGDICAGMVNLIDALQDAAVADGIATEIEVFGEQNAA